MRYAARSGVANGLRGADIGLATNTLRDRAFFSGTVTQPILMREGMAALHSVVVSDLKWRPRDRLAFRAWLEEQDKRFLSKLNVQSEAVRQRITELEAQRDVLDAKRIKRLAPFYAARAKYFDWVCTHRWELQYLLDPVVSVHPDEVAFEAFSRDESSYARLALRRDLFENIGDYSPGTTNIDFSASLHHEFERVRSYRSTRFAVDRGGFTVERDGEGAVREKKIDLPESWIKGFLQVQSVMTLGLSRLTLAPVDVFNITRAIKRRRAKVSPRALRWELTPGRPATVVLEPWNESIELSPVAVYDGPQKVTVRTWGRERLFVLERLIAPATKFTVFLSGQAMPTVWLADLGPMRFTLALSGWTDNDWAGGAKFDLLSRRLRCTPAELTQAHTALASLRAGSDTALASAAQLSLEKSRSAMSYLCQTGRAMYDLAAGVYRHRELFDEPFTAAEATVTAYAPSPGEEAPEALDAQQIFSSGGVFVTARRKVSDGHKLTGSVKASSGLRVRPVLHVDEAGRVIDASCSCADFGRRGLTQGPCEHVLALRLAHLQKLEEEGN